MAVQNGEFVVLWKGREQYFVRRVALRTRLEEARTTKAVVGLVMALAEDGQPEMWAEFEKIHKFDSAPWRKVAQAVKDVIEASKAQAKKPATTRIEKLWIKLGLTSTAPSQMESEVDQQLKIVRVRWTRDFYLANKSRCYHIMDEMRQAAPSANLNAWWAQGWLCFQPK